jgi:radical SAM superfamily enzyme with C-terminal helix-hairpin-helix motif
MRQDNGLPYWAVQGRYGYWAVDEHRHGSTAVYGTVDTFRTRKSAQRVADALNTAHARGWTSGVEHAAQVV